MFTTGIMHQLGAKVVCITDNQLNYEIIIYIIPWQSIGVLALIVRFWTPKPFGLHFCNWTVLGAINIKGLGASLWNENLNLLVQIKFLNLFLYICLNKNWKVNWFEHSSAGLGSVSIARTGEIWTMQCTSSVLRI